MNSDERALLRERIDAARRANITVAGCPNGHARGTTGYRHGCRCVKCRVESGDARNERRYRQGTRKRPVAFPPQTNKEALSMNTSANGPVPEPPNE